jgi:hypothetical protein
VSYAAITLCVASPVFTVLRVMCEPRFSVISKMGDFKEQRIYVKFFFELEKTASETHEMLKTAFGDNTNILFTSEESESSQVEYQEHVF